MSPSDEIVSPDIESIPTPIEQSTNEGNEKNFAQNMTEAIYQVHATVNDVLMGEVDENDSAEAAGDNEIIENTTENTENTETTGNTETTENIENTIATNPSTNTTSQSTFISPHLAKEQIKYCQRILKGLKRHRDSSPFLLPVDPVALNIPDYLTVIKHPMDLSTISKKMELGEYATAEAFMSDVRLMLNNCFTYNAPESGVAKMGRSLEKYFNSSMAKMPASEADLLVSESASSMAAAAAAANAEAEQRRQRRESKPVAALNMAPAGRFTAPETFSFCSGVLRELMKKTNAHLNWPFMLPVDPVALNIPDYLEIIKNPMDLSTIRKKLDSKMYASMDQFEEDVRLMFSNCYTYNPPESDVHKMGRQLEAIFDSKWAAKPQPKAAKPAVDRRSSGSVASSSAAHAAPASSSTSASASSFHSLPQQFSVSQLVPGFDAIEDDSEKILAINYQIQLLQAELNNLLLKRKSPYASGASSSASINAGAGSSAGSTGKSRASAPKKKSVTSPLQASSTPLSSGTQSASSAATAAAQEDSSLPKPFTLNEMTFEEKKKLSEDVGTLAPEQLMRVLEIIEKCMPTLHKSLNSDVIELDIEALDTYTLRVMQAYIWECMNPGKKRPGKGASSQAPAPKKEKVADGNGNVSVSIASTDDESSSDEE